MNSSNEKCWIVVGAAAQAYVGKIKGEKSRDRRRGEKETIIQNNDLSGKIQEVAPSRSRRYHLTMVKKGKDIVAREGIEPATSALLARRSNQLS